MKKRWLAIVLALGTMAALMPPAGAKTGHRHSMKSYAAEHAARGHRHHTRRPSGRHARMQRYAAEHRARQHRHRAHLKAQRQGE